MEIQGLYERNPTSGVEQCRDFLASSERFSFKFPFPFTPRKLSFNFPFPFTHRKLSIIFRKVFCQLPFTFTPRKLFSIHRKVFFQIHFSFYPKKTFQHSHKGFLSTSLFLFPPPRAKVNCETNCRFVMVRRGDVYGLMVEHFAKQGQYKQASVIQCFNINIASSVIRVINTIDNQK